MKKHRFILIAAAVFLLCGQVLASGFALFEHSTRGMGRGGAMVAQADDASAVYYNPAGITQLEGLHWDVGVTPITPIVNVSDMNGNVYDADDDPVMVPHVHVTYQINDKFFLGAGVFAPFGLATTFDENWAGRYNNYNGEVSGINFNINLAYKVNDQLSLAFGVSAQYFDVTLEQKILPSAVIYSQRDAIVADLEASGLDPYTADLIYNTQILAPSAELADIDQSITGDKTELTYNFGLRYELNDMISFGVSYRSNAKYKIDGQAKYQDVTQGFAFPFEAVFYDAPGLAVIELPDFLYFGMAIQPNDQWTFEIDAWQTGWSTYSDIDLTLENGLGHQVSEKGWDDVWALRMGAEYQINDKMYANMGYVYDDSPIPEGKVDYTLPSNDRQVLSFGYGMKVGKFTLDASYAYLKVTDRHVAARPQDFIFESDLEGIVHLFSVGLTYKR